MWARYKTLHRSSHYLLLSFIFQRRDHSENHDSSRYFPPWFSRKRSSGVTKGDSWLSLNQRQPCDIDRHCRKLFPMAYALFLSIYFVVYYFADIWDCNLFYSHNITIVLPYLNDRGPDRNCCIMYSPLDVSDITRSAGQRLFKSCTRQSIVITSVLLFSLLNLQN